MNRRRVHYVLSTHWDREWYQTFQDYRYWLVQLLDRVLDGFASGELQGPFQTDGQAIMIEDYLEVRPERRHIVEQLVRDGKLVLGPWYVLPDEFLVTGESLIRNLEYGFRLARSLGGEPSKAGFLCDIFGHNSQMPQIFTGFGIRGGFIWRGTNVINQRLMLWRGADGTELPCYRFGQVGYCDFAVQVRHANVFDYSAPAQQVIHDLDAYLANEAQKTETQAILAFDGGDHMEWDRRVYAVLAERLGKDDGDFEINHTSLDDYLGEMLQESSHITTLLEGELREPGIYPYEQDQQWLTAGVLASRVWIKQANATCQILLCQWAEPLSAMAHAALGCELPHGYLDIAWKWLLQNHPHDSICGCSIDDVHEDMRYRFHQSQVIAEKLRLEAGRKLALSIDGDVSSDEIRVVVFNPQPQPFDQTTELALEIPPDWQDFNEFFGYESKQAFRIYDALGTELPYQRLGQEMNSTRFRRNPLTFPAMYKVNVVQVSLPLKIPALGYTTLVLQAGEKGLPTRYPEAHGLATSERSMENEFLSVTIEPNGTLTLLDKRTGETYHRLLTFEDRADIGDGWYHGVALNDQIFISSTCHASVAQVHHGPYLTTFRIRTTMQVPSEFDFPLMKRSKGWSDMVIDTQVSLRPGTEYVEIETHVQNCAKDHRLRVLFPSEAKSSTILSDSPFDVVQRPVTLRGDNYLYREQEIETRPQQSWSAIYGERRGLAIISHGLMEVAVPDLPDRPLALTLFRSTRRTHMTDGEPLGQVQGELYFRYWITPLQGAPDRVQLFRLGGRLATGLVAVELSREDFIGDPPSRKIPTEASFLHISGGVVPTSVRQVGEDLEVRVFNPENQPAQAIFELAEPGLVLQAPADAQKVDFEGHVLGSVDRYEGRTVWATLRPKEILTIRLSGKK